MATILVVDDDREQCEIRKLLLETAGHKVSVATSSTEAVCQLAEQSPAVVLMDLHIPNVEDALSLIRHIRAQSTAPKILVLSGWPEALEDCSEAVLVDRVLAKPGRTKVLLDTIAELL